MSNKRYPDIHIRSKNELAKRLSVKGLNNTQITELINDVLVNFNKYWRDHPRLSRPKDEKWVRDASFTPLGKLLEMISTSVLKPYDNMLPDFLFGGISGRNHKDAVRHLLGRKRGRVLLKLDISRFYEQISKERVEQFFAVKAGCGRKGATLLASLCCVQLGAKASPQDRAALARGFATSSRLAVWCNLDTFLKLDRLIKKELKGKDPRLAIYVDDIGITASKVTKEEFMHLYPKIKAVLEADRNQPLPLNSRKSQIVFHSGETYSVDGKLKGRWGFEHLGVQMRRNSLTTGSKSRWKIVNISNALSNIKGKSRPLRRTKRALARYKRYIES